MPADSFLYRLRNWIRFIHNTGTDMNERSKRQLLFHLFLHPQVLHFYESQGIQLYDSPIDTTGDQFSGHRLFKHFCAWLDAVESENPILTCTSDNIFDGAQHFISSEWINTCTDANDDK